MKGSQTMDTQTDFVERVYLMQVAAGPPPANTPVVCYLVQTKLGRNILIDSGLPDPAHLPAGMPELIMGPNVIEQLTQIGLQSDDIDTLVCTHFDMDHSGQHAAFPQAEFVVQRAHYEHARTHPRYTNARPHWDRAELRYRLIDGDTELLPGIELIESSGHVPGHQAVLLRLPKTGPLLLTIDAVPDQGSFTPDRQGGQRDLDAVGVIAATHKLLDLAARAQVAFVIFGHDGAQWAKLRKAPAYYS